MKQSEQRIHGTPGSILEPQMPVLERIRARYGRIRPSIGALCGLQHLFGSTATLIDRITGGIVDPQGVFLLGKPYSANPDVVRHLRDTRGFWVHPRSTGQPLGRANDRAMDRRIGQLLSRVRRHLRRSPGRALLIDDGGRAIRMLHDRRFADIRHRFTCVEQTRCGIRTIEDVDLEIPVVNVAESWLKLEYESPIIADSVHRELDLQLRAMRAAGIPVGRTGLVIGYGAIGRSVAGRLRASGTDVAVHDRDADRRELARADGFPVAERLHAALESSRLIVGCTGKPALGRPDYGRVADGACLVSTSSADVEFQAWNLRPGADCLGCPGDGFTRRRPRRRAGGNPCFDLFRVSSGARHFFLVNGGFPVNFNGGVDPIPPATIQLTRTLLYLGALQATEPGAPGLHALDDTRQRVLLQIFRSVADRRAA